MATRPASHAGDKPIFSFEHADRAYDGEWGFHQDDQSSHRVMHILCEMARLTWGEIWNQRTGRTDRRKKHHAQPIDSLSSEAQSRIRELKLDELFDEEIFRFRDGGLERLWGFLRDGVFYVVWWDPDHRVYPTERG